MRVLLRNKADPIHAGWLLAAVLPRDIHSASCADAAGVCSLQLAAMGGHWQVAQLLLTAKSQIDAHDTSKRTALHEAAEGGANG